MAGNVIDRQLTARCGRVQFAVAAPGDDAEIRHLLRDNPMAGQISISLEREPDYFADANLPGENRQTIIARESGHIVCAGYCAVRQRFVNGAACRVGYLGGLRLDAKYAGRFDILRRGYQFFRELQADFPADFYFTSIASDNQRARWFLERGLSGMPIYEHVGDFVTLLIPTNQRWVRKGEIEHKPGSWEEIVATLNQINRRYQFAPCWSEAEMSALTPLGLKLDDFYQITCGSESVCAAIWDQRVFKQTVIRGYASPLKQARPLLNFASRFTGGIRLPAVGETLANAFVLNLAASEKPGATVQLLKMLLSFAAERGIELLSLGFAANNLRLSWIRQCFRCREYHSRLYVVRWPELGGTARELNGQNLSPEVALL
jgi:hypothetical protein